MGKSAAEHNMTDLELFRCLQSGDERAFTIIYERYAHVLYVLAACYLKSRADAEDAVQHVFMRLWESRRDMMISVSLKNFLYTSVKNYVLNFIRDRRSVLMKNLEMYNRSADTTDPNAEQERDEINAILERAISDIRHAGKQSIVQYRRDGLSNKEIAALLHIPENTVKTYYAQALKALKEHFRKIMIIIALLLTNL